VSVSVSVSVLVDFVGSGWFESCTEPLARCVFDGDQQRVGSASLRRVVSSKRCKATSSRGKDFPLGRVPDQNARCLIVRNDSVN
jgi:hypothetical protein